MVLTRIAKQIRLDDFTQEIQKRMDSKEEGAFTLFGGSFSSLRHAQAECQLELFYYQKAVSNENFLKQALENDGLTSEQIEKVASEGKYVKKVKTEN